MYGKCSDFKTAEQIFQDMPKHDILTMKMILELFGKEQPEKAKQFYDKMKQEGVTSDDKVEELLKNIGKK